MSDDLHLASRCWQTSTTEPILQHSSTMATEQAEAVQLSLPLPRSLDTRIYIRLSTRAKAIVLSLTTASQDEPASTAPMGSFVYALPNVSTCF